MRINSLKCPICGNSDLRRIGFNITQVRGFAQRMKCAKGHTFYEVDAKKGF